MAPKKEYPMEPGRDFIGEAAAGVSERAEELAGSIGQTMDSAAQAVQDTLRRTKKTAGAAMESVAGGIETSKEYLSERGMTGMIDDMETIIRRYPFQALLIGLSVGYLLSRSRHR